MDLNSGRTSGILQIIWDNRYSIAPFLILFTVIAALLGLQGNDRLFLEVNGFHSKIADFLFVNLTNMGNGFIAFLVVLVLLRVSYRESLTFLVVTLLLSLLEYVLKKILFPEFIRPVLYFGPASLHLIPGYNPPLLHTFPSGHSITAFSVCLFLSFLITKKLWKFFLFFVALIIGYSRIYISAHFPFDVVMGSFLAVVVTTLAFYLSRQIHNDWIDKRIRVRINFRSQNNQHDS